MRCFAVKMRQSPTRELLRELGSMFDVLRLS